MDPNTWQAALGARNDDGRPRGGAGRRGSVADDAEVGCGAGRYEPVGAGPLGGAAGGGADGAGVAGASGFAIASKSSSSSSR